MEAGIRCIGLFGDGPGPLDGGGGGHGNNLT
jgi:hypothetical protein